MFGRGGEEVLALRAAGVTFDVVPGVTRRGRSPSGCEAILVTQRGGRVGVSRGGRPRRGDVRRRGQSGYPKARVHACGADGCRSSCAHWRGQLIDRVLAGPRLRSNSFWMPRGQPRPVWRGTLLDRVEGNSTSVAREPVRRGARGAGDDRDRGSRGARLGRESRQGEERTAMPGRRRSPQDLQTGALCYRSRTMRRSRRSWTKITVERYERGEMTADQWRAYRLVRGTYGQRQAEDAQMLRVKIPQGLLTAGQLLRARQMWS